MPTLSITISDSADDAQETGGAMSLTGAALNANSATQISAMRFANVTVPPGSAIGSATLELYLPSGSFDDPDVTIRAGGTADATAFTTTAYDITNRAKTSAAVTWTASNLGAGARPTPELKTLVEEAIAIPGWASGNALAFYVQGNNSASLLRWAATGGSDPAATLSISYTPPAAGQPRRTMHQARSRG